MICRHSVYLQVLDLKSDEHYLDLCTCFTLLTLLSFRNSIKDSRFWLIRAHQRLRNKLHLSFSQSYSGNTNIISLCYICGRGLKWKSNDDLQGWQHLFNARRNYGATYLSPYFFHSITFWIFVVKSKIPRELANFLKYMAEHVRLTSCSLSGILHSGEPSRESWHFPNVYVEAWRWLKGYESRIPMIPTTQAVCGYPSLGQKYEFSPTSMLARASIDPWTVQPFGGDSSKYEFSPTSKRARTAMPSLNIEFGDVILLYFIQNVALLLKEQ